MRVKLVAGNWKMNGNLASNQVLLKAIIPAVTPFTSMKCAVCAPFPYLAQVKEILRGTSINWGAQDLCEFDDGPYTGGVSAAMLADLGCHYVIVGHSERRSAFGDTDDMVALKFAAAVKHRLTPILCVGEKLAERESGITETVVGRQLDAVIEHCGSAALGHGVVAYEPVWAIGTGRTATPQQAQSVHAFIRARVATVDEALADRLVILYGGSVKAANAAQLFAMPDVDGGLIGGASLVAEEFIGICRAAVGPEETVRV
jgi:triosephosphate isomerase (TIM)